MSKLEDKVALLVRHQAKAGQRDRIQEIWKSFVQPKVISNTAHEQYFFCFDNNDPDVVCAFQIFSSKKALQDFLASDSYPGYLAQVGEVIQKAPEITEASIQWKK